MSFRYLCFIYSTILTGGSSLDGANPSFAISITPPQSPMLSNGQSQMPPPPPPPATPTGQAGTATQARRLFQFRAISPAQSDRPESPPTAPRGISLKVLIKSSLCWVFQHHKVFIMLQF